jgi:hypothetical protein
MRKLKYVKLFENFYDEELLKTDKSKFIDHIINKLKNNEDISFKIVIEETYISNKISYFLHVSKPGIEKGKVDGGADMIRVSGDSLKNMTQEQFEELYNLLPYKGGRKGDRWANNTSSPEAIKRDQEQANQR